MKSYCVKALCAGIGLACLSTGLILACGPDFPNLLLFGGDQSLLKAPFTIFGKEIARMNLGRTKLKAVPAQKNQPQHKQTITAELADLRLALQREKRTADEIQSILERHAEQRDRILFLVEKSPKLAPVPEKARISHANPPRSIPELPGEYADYFRGSIFWHDGKTPEARKEWYSLLERPPDQRQDKSTWAAYMLGKSFEKKNPDQARHWFQETRRLAKNGFKDSLGLAAASLGWEARIHLQENQFVEAIHLYLQQDASGADNAKSSLKLTVTKALQSGPESLQKLARDPRSRQVVTTYLIAGGDKIGPIDVDGSLREIMAIHFEKWKIPPSKGGSWHQYQWPADLWLDAVEKAKVDHVLEAEKLALTAYRAGQMDRASRWIALAPKTPAARWLEAKLQLRQGNVAQAAALLTDLTRLFPQDPTHYSSNDLSGLAHSLIMIGNSAYRHSMPDQVRAELGVLLLARRDYTEALDALLRSGFWLDASYVAERVLTLEELKQYVDRHWPTPTPVDLSRQDKIGQQNKRIRYLLARRLARQHSLSLAEPYYPPEQQAHLRQLMQALSTGRNADHGQEDRAQAYWQAALLTRHQGMELMGTEGGPDWTVHQGSFQYGTTLKNRMDLSSTNAVRPSAEEIQRGLSHGTTPDKRFHYRYQAAELAWQAASLLPDQDDETARMLCLAGTWLKIRDPLAADKYYKALVIRCGNTEWGRRADQRRWFPTVDQNGLLPPHPKPEQND